MVKTNEALLYGRRKSRKPYSSNLGTNNDAYIGIGDK